jgi:phage terminase small subunit
MQSPLLSVVNNCVDTVTKLSREFGLTPAARSRIAKSPSQDDFHYALEAALDDE